MFDFTGTYTDRYQLAMAEAYFLAGRSDDRAVFDYFFRDCPFGGGYALFAGLNDALKALETLRFETDDLAFLKEQGLNADFLRYLSGFRFTGTVRAAIEGDVVFPGRPVLTVEAPLIEAQLVETLLLNILNYQTLIATKASRMRRAAGQAGLADFGLRRAQGPGGHYAARAAVIGGFDSTSNVRAAQDYGLPLSGTMAHSFVQAHESELAAFQAFAKAHPDNCVLLVDTYDTLRSGVPNAIRVGKEMAARGDRLKGIRLDSGDLAYLSRSARRMLDDAGLPGVKIAASNKLDETTIKSLKEQGAPIDLFGVGTNLVIGAPDGALDGVYKLVAVNARPCLKLSETREKITLPGRKQVYRLTDPDGVWLGLDGVAMADEDPPKRFDHSTDPDKRTCIGNNKLEPVLHKVMTDGKVTIPLPDVMTLQARAADRLARLDDAYKRFDNPHLYRVGLSPRLKQARDDLARSMRRTE
ncbi:nicotinate phosphoribosyltransferase [Yunchengibacter salinarum]|uniref:nicotinate phosphoribosyltransferase n=1 Tax=Yunchengibacter salinarum TaxID=3133399 RepID=UPI0035B5D0BB